MSLGIVIKGPEGVVLAADSRVTLSAQRSGGPLVPVNFDNATKLLSFPKQPFIGGVTYGVAAIGVRTAHSFLPEFDLKLEETRLTVEAFAKKLSAFFRDRWQKEMPKDYQGPDMTFIVGGYDAEDAYGKVFLFGIPRQPEPVTRNPEDFGMTWGGQLELVSRMIHGYDPQLIDTLRQTLSLSSEQVSQLMKALEGFQFPIPYAVLPLQDCIDLAISMIRTTISFQKLAVAYRGVGGPIDVAVITRTRELKFVQKKEIHGELGITAKDNINKDH